MKMIQVAAFAAFLSVLSACSGDDATVSLDPKLTVQTSPATWLTEQRVPAVTQGDVDTLTSEAKTYTDYYGLGSSRWTAANMKPLFDIVNQRWKDIPGSGTYKEYPSAAATAYNNESLFSTKPVFKGGKFQEGELLGAHSQSALTHYLRMYNFLNAVGNLPRSAYSELQQAAAMASSWTAAKGLSGSHNPTEAMGIDLGLTDLVFNLAAFGRINSSLGGASSWNTKTPAGDVFDDGAFNESLINIWNEGEGDSIKTLGHRNAFITARPLIGLGNIPSFRSYMNYQSYLSKFITPYVAKFPYLDPAKADVASTEQKAFAAKVDVVRKAKTFTTWPGELVPTVALNVKRHQAFSILMSGTAYTLKKAGEPVTLKLSFYCGSTVATLAACDSSAFPDKTITTVSSASDALTVGKGVYNPYTLATGTPSTLTKPVFDDLTKVDAQYTRNGHYLDVRQNGGLLVFRVPFEWWYKISQEFTTATAPKIFQIRAEFDLTSTDPIQGGSTASPVTKSEFRYTIYDISKHTALN